jgi:hypothetical protein
MYSVLRTAPRVNALGETAAESSASLWLGGFFLFFGQDLGIQHLIKLQQESAKF